MQVINQVLHPKARGTVRFINKTARSTRIPSRAINRRFYRHTLAKLSSSAVSTPVPVCGSRRELVELVVFMLLSELTLPRLDSELSELVEPVGGVVYAGSGRAAGVCPGRA